MNGILDSWPSGGWIVSVETHALTGRWKREAETDPEPTDERCWMFQTKQNAKSFAKRKGITLTEVAS